GGFVEAETKSAAKVRQSHTDQASVERGDPSSQKDAQNPQVWVCLDLGLDRRGDLGRGRSLDRSHGKIPLLAGALCSHDCDHGKAGTEAIGTGLMWIEYNPYGHTLHYFCEIASCVIRRQQRELRTAGRGDLVDVAAEDHSR